MPGSPDPSPGKSTVELSRRALAALVGALVAALVGLAFFVGRETARSTLPEAVATAPTAAAPSEVPPAAAPASSAAPIASDTRQVVEPRGDLPASNAAAPAAVAPSPAAQPAPITPSTPVPAAPPPHPDRDTAARYFEEVESIQASGSAAGDPKAFATALLSQSAQGDWSEFDKMTREQRSMLDRLQRLSVPAPCREHHSRSVALMRESMALLDSVKTGIQTGDVGVLTELSTRAQKLQTEAARVQALADAVRRQVGLQN